MGCRRIRVWRKLSNGARWNSASRDMGRPAVDLHSHAAIPSNILWREVIVRDETSLELKPGRSEGEEKPIRAKIFAMGGPSKSADRPFRLFAKTGSGRIYGKKALWMFVGKGSVTCAHS
jgi:hypothetical protein